MSNFKPNYFQRRSKPQGPKANERIKALDVQVIGSEGNNLGVMQLKQAIQMAQSGDIVPVTPVRKQTQNGECLIIPEEAGYGMTEIPLRFLRSS